MTASETTPLSERFDRIQRAALVVGVLGLALCGVQLYQNPTAFFQSYLFVFPNGLVVGGLGIMLMHNVTGGELGVVIRRIAEASSRLLPVMAVLILPLIIGLVGWHELYIWSRPEVVAHDKNIQLKAAWLNIPFWVARAVFYFAVWTFWAWRLNRLSAEQDRTADSGIQERMRKFSAPGLLLFVITATFAYVDWIMSLEPQWFSTMFGAMFMIGQVLETLAFAVVLLYWLSSRWPFLGALKVQHYWDLGNLLLAFTMLWAYLSLAVSDHLVRKSAGGNPVVHPAFQRRLGSDRRVRGVISLRHAVLHSADAVRQEEPAHSVSGGGLALLLAHCGPLLDRDTGPAPARLLLRVERCRGAHRHGGIWVAAFIWQFRKRPLLPLHDARLCWRRKAIEDRRWRKSTYNRVITAAAVTSTAMPARS